MEVSIILDNKLVKNYDFSIRERQSLDSWIGKIEKKDTRLYKVLVFTVAGLNYASTVLADTTAAIGKIDSAGIMFLGLAQSIGYYLCLIGCIVEILKSVMNGTSKDAGKIMMKYILYFAALYLMPFAFDMIKNVFQ